MMFFSDLFNATRILKSAQIDELSSALTEDGYGPETMERLRPKDVLARKRKLHPDTGVTAYL